jgi:tetratricopeptide (TPR) repeat protein
MNTILRPACIALLLSVAGTAFAQKSTQKEEISRADRQFGLYAYQEALQGYQLVLKKTLPIQGRFQEQVTVISELNKPEKAVIWYEKAVKQRDVAPEVHLGYGKALMQTGDYDLAKEQFLVYADENEDTGRHFADVRLCTRKHRIKDCLDGPKMNRSIRPGLRSASLPLRGNKVVFTTFNNEFAAASKSNGKGRSKLAPSLAQVSQQTGQLQNLQAFRVRTDQRTQ